MGDLTGLVNQGDSLASRESHCHHLDPCDFSVLLVTYYNDLQLFLVVVAECHLQVVNQFGLLPLWSLSRQTMVLPSGLSMRLCIFVCLTSCMGYRETFKTCTNACRPRGPSNPLYSNL
jgi:hypothetical protein